MKVNEQLRLANLVLQLLVDYPEGKAQEATVIMASRFGSHLYGTDTSASDTDIKGVFMPTRRMVVLGEIPNSIAIHTANGVKNTADDVDIELWSFQYFMELLMRGDTNAVDLLHSNTDNILFDSTTWMVINDSRHEFYTKSMSAFVEYARSQAAKYGLKGSRLATAQEFVDTLNTFDANTKMTEVWNMLPVNDHAYFIEDDPKGIKQYYICGKTVQSTTKVSYCKNIMDIFISRFGERARLAERNEGIDWKAISHALRAAYQLRAILVDGDLHYPLAEATYLRNVKLGKFHYINEVAPVLEGLMDELEEACRNSSYPNEVDREKWEHFIEYQVSTLVF